MYKCKEMEIRSLCVMYIYIYVCVCYMFIAKLTVHEIITFYPCVTALLKLVKSSLYSVL